MAFKRHIATAFAAALMLIAAPTSAQAAGGVCVVDSGAHGASMLQTAQSAARGAAVSYVEVAPAQVTAGIASCTAQGAQVISVSWALERTWKEWERVIADASARGVLVLAAAGNADAMGAACQQRTCPTAIVPGAVSVSTDGQLPGQVMVDGALFAESTLGGSSAATAYAAGVAARSGARDVAALAAALAADVSALGGEGEDADQDSVAAPTSARAPLASASSVRKLRFAAKRSGRRVVVTVAGLRAGQRLVVKVGRDSYRGSRSRVSVRRAVLPRRVTARVLQGSKTVTSLRLTVRR